MHHADLGNWSGSLAFDGSHKADKDRGKRLLDF